MAAFKNPSTSIAAPHGAQDGNDDGFQFAAALPDEPVIRIRPGASWLSLDLKDVWAHRELLYQLIWRDLKVRYKQTVLGAAWVVLQPVSTTIIFTLFLTKMLHVPSANVPYPLFLYAGLLLWTFFSNAILGCAYSLVANTHVLTKVYFPRLLFPCAAIGVRLVDFIIASGVLVALMIYYGVPLTRSVLLMPLIIAEVTLLALALGIGAAALNVMYRDVGTVLPVLLQLWMFLSPIVYSLTVVPHQWQWLYRLNPVVGIVECFRAALFGLEFNARDIIVSTFVTLALLVLSVHTFRRMEDSFADVI
jgi:lipopolysaccharide transport system permease protein